MAVVPGQQIGRELARLGFLPPRQSDCYAHGADDGMRSPVHEQALAQFSPAAFGVHWRDLERRLKAQGFASAEIIARWADIVGAEIAAHSEPMKINWPRAVGDDAAEPATLVLRVEGPAALEIQHLSAVILERVNRFFGWQAIGRIALAPGAAAPARAA